MDGRKVTQAVSYFRRYKPINADRALITASVAILDRENSGDAGQQGG
jgi:hypothetical protein